MDGNGWCVDLAHCTPRNVVLGGICRDFPILRIRLATQPVAVFVSEVVVAAAVEASVAHQVGNSVEFTHARSTGTEILPVSVAVTICEHQTEPIPKKGSVLRARRCGVCLTVDRDERGG